MGCILGSSTLWVRNPHSLKLIERKTKKDMRIIVTIIFLLWILIWVIFSLVLLSITALIDLATNKERKLTLRASYLIARTVYITCPMWRVKVEGKENLADGKPYVITANHQSFFDIPLMFFIPNNRGFKFVSKIEVRNIPAIGWMLGLRGDIVIRRGTREAATTVMTEGSQHLQAGVSVAIFPEGTRTKDGEVHRFKDGAFRLAQENNVEILPCVMDDTKRLFSARGLNRRQLTVRILPPISAEEVVATPARELAERVEEMTRTALAEMRAQKTK